MGIKLSALLHLIWLVSRQRYIRVDKNWISASQWPTRICCSCLQKQYIWKGFLLQCFMWVIAGIKTCCYSPFLLIMWREGYVKTMCIHFNKFISSLWSLSLTHSLPPSLSLSLSLPPSLSLSLSLSLPLSLSLSLSLPLSFSAMKQKNLLHFLV